jgi:succinate-semialdehyde dehydrogenase/glutarate-semialdehyde dehydrogenase
MTAPLTSPLLGALDGYWDGRFQPRPSAPRIDVHDPATGDVIARVPTHGADEARLAVDSAARALASPLDRAARGRVLAAIEASLLEHRDALATILTTENGKPLAEARGEIEYAAGFFRDAATHLDALAPVTLAARPRGLTWQVHHRPAGVAALITPWNFPIGMLAKKLAGAIAAGCPSVVKPSELTPLSCIAWFTLLDGLGLPPGFVNLVFGDAPAIGAVFCSHPAVRVVSFTGSTAVGRLLAAQAAPNFKRLSLELGGNAPFLVFDDADVDLAVDALLANKFRCGGQTCVCANRVYVGSGVADRFVDAVTARVRALVVGHGLDEGVAVGPLIDEKGVAKVTDHVRDAVARGARVVTGGVPAGGAFFPPTVLTGVTSEMRCANEETFGPVVAITAFDDEEAMVEAADATPYGLAAYVFTRDATKAERVVARLRFGHVGVNTGSGPTPEAPFGGFRTSGVGREGGLEGVLEFIELQTVPHG